MTKLAVVIALACGCRSDKPAKLAWATDEKAAFERARAEHTGVMIELYASWAMPCEELGRELHGERVAAALRGTFVPVRIDVTNDNGDIQARYGAKTLPAVLFVTTDGTVRARIDRVIEEPAVIATIERAAAR
ncbi:MAG: thioredoxin family protein [Acidobacteriota bacterium]